MGYEGMHLKLHKHTAFLIVKDSQGITDRYTQWNNDRLALLLLHRTMRDFVHTDNSQRYHL